VFVAPFELFAARGFAFETLRRRGFVAPSTFAAACFVRPVELLRGAWFVTTFETFEGCVVRAPSNF